MYSTNVLQFYNSTKKCYMHTSPYVLHMCDSLHNYEVNTSDYIHNTFTVEVHMCKCEFSSSGVFVCMCVHPQAIKNLLHEMESE